MRKEITILPELLRDCGIPRAYWELGRSTFPGFTRNKGCFDQLDEFLSKAEAGLKSFTRKNGQSNANGFTILAPPENGKTYFLTAAAMSILSFGQTVEYVDFSQLADFFVTDKPRFYTLAKFDGWLALDNVKVTTVPFIKDVVLPLLLQLRKDWGWRLMVSLEFESWDEFEAAYSSQLRERISGFTSTLVTPRVFPSELT